MTDLERCECGGGACVEMSHGESSLVLYHPAILVPVDGGGGVAVHGALEHHIVAWRLLDPGPGNTDLGTIPHDETGGHVDLGANIVAGHTQILALVRPGHAGDPIKQSDIKCISFLRR